MFLSWWACTGLLIVEFVRFRAFFFLIRDKWDWASIPSEPNILLERKLMQQKVFNCGNSDFNCVQLLCVGTLFRKLKI